MKKTLFCLFVVGNLWATPGVSLNVVTEFAAYSGVHSGVIPGSSYRPYLSLGYMSIETVPNGLIRQPNNFFAGDYFWPPNAFQMVYPDSSAFAKSLTFTERNQIEALIERYYAPRFSDTAIISSLQGYYYEFYSSSSYHFECGPRREFYTMLAEGDTIFVVSGIMGKFMSFYRAVPGDFRLSPEQFLSQVRGVSSIIDGLKIAGGDLTQKDDPDNYLLQYINKQALIRLRNYQLEAVLPPADPGSRTPRIYNLIEITKILDGSIIGAEGEK